LGGGAGVDLSLGYIRGAGLFANGALRVGSGLIFH